MPDASVQPKVDFKVMGRLRALRQPNRNACWATVATILCSWKNNRDETIEDVLASAGHQFLALFMAKQPLHHTKVPAFLRALHLTAEPPMSFGVDGFEQLLRAHGPFWVTADENPSIDFSVHGRVLVGLRGDGTPENTVAFILDPNPGALVVEPVAVLQEKMIQLAFGDIQFGGTTAQIIHF